MKFDELKAKAIQAAAIDPALQLLVEHEYTDAAIGRAHDLLREIGDVDSSVQTTEILNAMLEAAK